MSILFKPMKIGCMEVKNRFIRSATGECMATITGEVTDQMIKFYKTLAKGEIGLIITGIMYIHPSGKVYKDQTGIQNDDMISGLKKISDCVHKEGGKIAFQIAHAGLETSKDLIPGKAIGPSHKRRSPFTFIKSKEMDKDQIYEIIKAFSSAIKRAFEADADAVEIHAAHGYLINQFLSPFFNVRRDEWGGSDEGRFLFLKEIILSAKNILPKDKALLVKLNTNDYTKKEGITPPLAVKYAKWLAELKIDGLEISCGTTHFSPYNIFRGNIPVNEAVQVFPRWQRLIARKILNGWIGKFDLLDEYNLEAAKMIKPVLNDVPLILVGGIRDVSRMEEILNNNYADFISMCRPFIREPYLVKGIKEGKIKKASCISCNRCFAAIGCRYPIGCYVEGFPKKK